MTTGGKITRRKFLWKITLLGIFSSVMPIQSFADHARNNIINSIAYRIRDILKNRHSAAIVGRGYLSIRPQEADKTALVDLICNTNNNYHVLLKGDNTVLRKHIIDCMHDDFANGVTVKVKGWILSQTEARLYALSAIL